jgi:hypothetical protein
MKNKKAAMEMSVGTIVTIVLLMSVLVLGLMLVKNIFTSSKGAVDLTDQQVHAELEKLFSEDAALIIYPTAAELTLKPGENDAFGIGIKNIAKTSGASTMFSYETVLMENTCGLSEQEVMDWIVLGASDDTLEIPIGKIGSGKMTIEIPEGTPNCIANFRIKVSREGESYESQIVTVQVKN